MKLAAGHSKCDSCKISRIQGVTNKLLWLFGALCQWPLAVCHFIDQQVGHGSRASGQAAGGCAPTRLAPEWAAFQTSSGHGTPFSFFGGLALRTQNQAEVAGRNPLSPTWVYLVALQRPPAPDFTFSRSRCTTEPGLRQPVRPATCHKRNQHSQRSQTSQTLWELRAVGPGWVAG